MTRLMTIGSGLGLANRSEIDLCGRPTMKRLKFGESLGRNLVKFVIIYTVIHLTRHQYTMDLPITSQSEVNSSSTYLSTSTSNPSSLDHPFHHHQSHSSHPSLLSTFPILTTSSASASASSTHLSPPISHSTSIPNHHQLSPTPACTTLTPSPVGSLHSLQSPLPPQFHSGPHQPEESSDQQNSSTQDSKRRRYRKYNSFNIGDVAFRPSFLFLLILTNNFQPQAYPGAAIAVERVKSNVSSKLVYSSHSSLQLSLTAKCALPLWAVNLRTDVVHHV